MSRKKIVTAIITAMVLVQIPLYSFGFGNRDKSHYSEPEGMALTDLPLEDGVYKGSADGFRPGLVVEVTVECGTVTDIVIVEHNEVGRQYWQRPISVIPGAIIEALYSKVDVVSGATSTSKAIMSAVEDALKTE